MNSDKFNRLINLTGDDEIHPYCGIIIVSRMFIIEIGQLRRRADVSVESKSFKSRERRNPLNKLY